MKPTRRDIFKGGLAAGVAVADSLFAETLAGLEGRDVGGDVLALVHELGVRAD